MANDQPHPSRPKPIVFGGAVSFTFTILLLSPIVPLFPRLLLFSLLLLGWILAGVIWFIRRYGKPAVISLVSFTLAIVVSVGIAYWRDAPNRRAAAQVKSLGAFYVGTTGIILTGEVDYVYFDENAGDSQVDQLTRMEGLGGLRRLVLKQTHISDATARRLAHFSGLRDLYMEATGVSPKTINQLRHDLPDCLIEVRQEPLENGR